MPILTQLATLASQTYKSVVENMALPSGLLMGLPVVFDTDDEALQPGDVALLKDGEREIATIEFTDKFTPDKPLECLKCYGTSQIEVRNLRGAKRRGCFALAPRIKNILTNSSLRSSAR